jgi:hypothetical protein
LSDTRREDEEDKLGSALHQAHDHEGRILLIILAGRREEAFDIQDVRLVDQSS